jgi:hypothetical protein
METAFEKMKSHQQQVNERKDIDDYTRGILGVICGHYESIDNAIDLRPTVTYKDRLWTQFKSLSQLILL